MKPRKTIFVIICVLISMQYLSGQNEVFKYVRPCSDATIKHFEVDSLGNNYAVGSFKDLFEYHGVRITGNANSEGDLFIMKTAPSGRPIYLRAIKGKNPGDNVGIGGLKINQRGEMVVIIKANKLEGVTIGKRFITLNTQLDLNLVVKISRSGYLVWVKVFKANGADPDLAVKSIEFDEQGNVYLAGDFRGASALLGGKILAGVGTDRNIFVTKFNHDGSHSWTASCEITDTAGIGGIFAHQLKVSPDGNVYLMGTHNGSKRFGFDKSFISNKGVSNSYLACYAADGQVKWAVPFEGVGEIQPEMISFDKDGNIVFTCFFKSDSFNVNGKAYASQTDFDLMVVSIGGNKQINWERSVTTDLIAVSLNSKEAVIRTGNGMDWYLIGKRRANSLYSVYYTKISTSGVLQSLTQTIGTGNANLEDAIIDYEGNGIFAGSTNANFTIDGKLVEDKTGYGAYYICNLNKSGTSKYAFTQQNSMTENVQIQKIASDKFGNLFVAGWYNGATANIENQDLGQKHITGLFFAEYGNTGEVSGKVRDFYQSPITSGIVKLIGYTIFQRSPISDSVEVSADGSYKFEDVPLGRYILKYIPSDSKYLQSYFPSAGGWQKALPIRITASDLNATNTFILVPERASRGGTARLSGTVTEIEEDDVFKAAMAKPRPKGRASLATAKVKSEYVVVAETETDEQGDFYFDDVEDGDYRIDIDVPGLPLFDPHTVTVFNGQFYSNIDYFIDEEQINPVGNPSSLPHYLSADNKNVLIYPNPSDGDVFILAKNNKSINEVEILNLQGKTILHYYDIKSELSISDLQKGIYLVRIKQNNASFNGKLIVN